VTAPDPITDATAIIVAEITDASHVIEARRTDPHARPDYGADPCLHTIARRAIAEMLNEGWTTPAGAEEGIPA
jgi:hypothetical protein